MTRSQSTPASSQIIALEGMVQKLEHQLTSAQARISELREAIVSVCCDPDGRVCIRGSNGDRKVLQDALSRTDNLSALEAAKSQARREALMEAADYVFDLDVDTSLFAIQTQLRRMAGEVKQ